MDSSHKTGCLGSSEPPHPRQCSRKVTDSKAMEESESWTCFSGCNLQVYCKISANPPVLNLSSTGNSYYVGIQEMLDVTKRISCIKMVENQIPCHSQNLKIQLSRYIVRCPWTHSFRAEKPPVYWAPNCRVLISSVSPPLHAWIFPHTSMIAVVYSFHLKTQTSAFSLSLAPLK